MIHLTVKERILLHLLEFSRHGEKLQVPPGMTQEGIAAAAWVELRHLTQYLRPLLGEDLVHERLAHVEGIRQRRKVYDLTDAGRMAAIQLRERVKAEVVSVREGPTVRKATLSQILGIAGGSVPLLEILHRLGEAEIIDPADLKASPRPPLGKGASEATQRARPLDKHRIAVLPLSNISPDPTDDYFADGMTEELISALSRIIGLRVIARTSVMRYKGATKGIAEIGQDLNVGTVVEGSVRKAGNKLRITVQLIDALSEEPLWSQDYDRELEDVFAIRGDIAQKIVGALRARMVRGEIRGVEKRSTENLDAYTLYLKGRYFWNKRTEEGLRKAIDNFEQAIEEDPGYALAYSGLADSYAILALLEFLPPQEAFPKAKRAASKALEIEDGLAEAHTSLGLVKFQYDWDWRGAEEEFKRAIELNPNYPPAHHFYADYLKAMGRFDEALGEITRAHELDPLSLAINTGMGHVLYLSRQYDKAMEQYRRTIELDPNFVQARLWFGRPYLQKGMYGEAIAELKQAVALSGGSTIALAMLGHAYASSGQADEALKILAELEERSKRRYVPSYWISVIHNGLGDKDRAFAWLDKAYRERSSWLVWIRVEPRFDPLRSDPRFESLVKGMGLS